MTHSTPYRILIVDDHPIMREGLTLLLGGESDMTICGEASDASSALHQVRKLKPDLVLADLTLPGRNGIELIKDILAIIPDLPVLVLSMHDESLYAERVLRAGGRGYIMKQEGGKKLKDAIRSVLAGKIHVSEQISSKLLESLSGRSSGKPASIAHSLTDRELEVFQWIGQGKSAKEIAAGLHLSVKTVEVHRAHIKEKLQVNSVPELIRKAVQFVESQGQIS